MRCAFTHRGGVLFEVVLSLALFAGAAAFTLAAVRSVFAAIDRVRLQQEAIDIARSKLAQLEAGLIPMAELRSGTVHEGVYTDWTLNALTHRSAFTGLTLVEVTVRPAVGIRAPDATMSYTLHQLVRLRADDGDVIDDEPAD